MAARNDVQYVRYYTEGSTARKLVLHVSAPGKVVQTERKPRKRKIIRIDPIAILGMVMAIALLICMAVGIARIQDIRRENAQLEGYVQQLEQETDRLKTEYKAGYDLEEVKQTALALGMIPREQATQITLQIQVPQQEVSSTLWSRIGTFLAGLLA